MRCCRAVSCILQIRLRAQLIETYLSGIYVPDTDDFPAHFRGMSVRVEDSVCVQVEHSLVLTTEAVKEVRLPHHSPFGDCIADCLRRQLFML